jgi:hypothetical protein
MARKLSEVQVDRQVVAAIWQMCHLARLWGVGPEGMLRRNTLISDFDVSRLEKWIEIVEHAAIALLNGLGMHEAINSYGVYIRDNGAGSNARQIAPLLESAIIDDDLNDPTDVVEALAAIGPAARQALPTLRKAATRTYRLVQPVDRFNVEVRAKIEAAIRRIEGECTDSI